MASQICGIQSLQTMWPSNFMYRIWDIITLHENIQIRSDLASANINSTDRWAEGIRRAINELLCPCQTQGDVCLLTEVTSHIISSNTTSVRNLFCRPTFSRTNELLKSGEKNTIPISWRTYLCPSLISSAPSVMPT